MAKGGHSLAAGCKHSGYVWHGKGDHSLAVGCQVGEEMLDMACHYLVGCRVTQESQVGGAFLGSRGSQGSKVTLELLERKEREEAVAQQE